MRFRPLILVVPFLAAIPLLAQTSALSVNTASREEVRQFYRAIYFASENVPMGWTGSYATGNAGDTSSAFKEATRLRVNFFRALVGVPAGITFNAVYSRKDQQAALMESVNALADNVLTLSHTPPTTWRFYTAEGAEAAANSNLTYGTAGPDAINSYVKDSGSNNAAAGHRRWLFVPQTLQMGTGDVPGDGTFARAAANALWILDTTPGGTLRSPRPATRTTHITYPPAGYVPYSLVWPRWSFSTPGADFSGATVTMTRGGQAVATRLEPLAANIGEPTLVWAYDNLDASSDTPHARPTGDTIYTVTVANVRIGGSPQNFSYTVTVFDPEVASADYTPVAISGPARPPLGTASTYAIALPSFTSGFDWRTIQLGSFAKTFTGESGLDGLRATTTPGYDMVQTFAAATGRSAYRFAHLNPRSDQILLFPEAYYVTGSNSAVSFLSRLGIATAIETARVQVSTDDGSSWSTVYTQAGTSASNSTAPSATEGAFVARTVSLGAYVGRVVRVRLAYAIEPSGIAFLPAPDNIVGWFVDDLTLINVQTATPGAAVRVATGTTFAYNATAAGSLGLQARALMAGAYPLDWSVIAPVTVIDPIANNDPGRIVNLSILTSLTGAGDSFTMGFVVSGGGGGKSILVRGAGPSLVPLGVTDALEDPKLEFFAGPTKTGENDNWGGTATLSTAFSSVAAFPFTGPASRDAAVLASITSADSSVKLSSANNGSGTVIAELYDMTPPANYTATTPRLVNVSVLKHLGTGLTAGFVIGGSTPKTVLIRAVGPTLGTAFGLGGVVANPQLALFNSSSIKIGENDDWGGTTALTTAFSRVAAFVLPAASRDAALVVTLPPAAYTVQVNGVDGTTGVALVEVYEIP